MYPARKTTTAAAAVGAKAAVEAEGEASAMEAGVLLPLPLVANTPGRCSEVGEAGDEGGEAATTTELTRIEEKLKNYPACNMSV